MGLVIGDVCYATIDDENQQNPKNRPCVVVLATATSVWVAAVSSTFDPSSLQDGEIKLPFQHPGAGKPCVTGLTKPSVVKCWWIREVPADKCRKVGSVPGKLMNAILLKVQSLAENRASPNPIKLDPNAPD